MSRTIDTEKLRAFGEKGQRALDEACRIYLHNDDIDILDIVDEDCDGGSWVTALIWIAEEES